MTRSAPDLHGSPTVAGFDRTTEGVQELDRWIDLARSTLIGESVTVGRLDLIFVDADEMAELNRSHMNEEGPTDVLAFPLDAGHDGLDFGGLGSHVPVPSDHDGDTADQIGPIMLGDVVICQTVAERQAPDHCGRFDAEMSLLVVHGVLHILGHDHGERREAALMQGRERHHLERLGFSHPEPI